MTVTSTHDTLREIERGTPAAFVLSAWLLPPGIIAQFLLAGQSLFGGLSWNGHALWGGLLALPVGALLTGAALVPRLRGFLWWAAALGALYAIQIGLAAIGGKALGLHPANGALLLVVSLALVVKVERRRTHRR